MPKHTLKSDKFRSSRGGYARMLEISCAKCSGKILTYQKDGPGPLLRMYMDRIHAPAQLTGLQYTPLNSISTLHCSHCDRMIAAPYLYKKEQRPAFRVFQGAVKKRIIKSV